MPSDFFVQTVTDTMATTAGTKQVFVIDNSGFFSFEIQWILQLVC